MPSEAIIRASLARRIRRHLPLTPVPCVPELRLHLAGPHSGLGRFFSDHTSPGPPYWAHVWSGGLVLARTLLDRPDLVTGRRVLDLGCGSGLVAIAAALAGARDVVAVDVDACAIVATTLNAALNGVSLHAEQIDLLDRPAPAVDLVLAGDVFYETALASRMTAYLERCTAAGCTVLVGDPGRAGLPGARLELIRSGATPDFGSGQAIVSSAVYRFGQGQSRPHGRDPVTGRKVTLPGSASA